jgi:hypothetical protein
MNGEERQALVDKLEQEIRPLLRKQQSEGGYNCCGCSTYEDILDHAIAIVQGAQYDGRGDG